MEEEGIIRDEELCSSDREKSSGLVMNAVKWTDEKHSLFLNSIEASFIDQLYSTELLPKDLLSQLPRAQKQLRFAMSSARDPSHGQVPQWGNWLTLHYEEGKSRKGIKKEAHVFSENQWVRHFRSSNSKEKHDASLDPMNLDRSFSQRSSLLKQMDKKECSKKMESSALYHHTCRLDSVGSISEVSDQNFTDEEVEKLSSRRKRVRTSFTNGEFRDQVVPSGLPWAEPNSDELQPNDSCVKIKETSV